MIRGTIIFLLAIALFSCSKSSPGNPYFTFNYENSNYSFDSIYAIRVSANSFRIFTFDTKTQPPVATSIKQQSIEFDLTSDTAASAALYTNKVCDKEVTATYLYLFRGNAQNGGFLSQSIRFDSLTKVTVNVTQISSANVEGTFSIIPSNDDPLTTVTEGRFSVPFR